MFDPLGLVAPVVFVMKILMQEIWKLRVDWEELPASVVERVTNWCTGLKDLKNLKIRPCYRRRAEVPVELQLHIFTDAS